MARMHQFEHIIPEQYLEWKPYRSKQIETYLIEIRIMNEQAHHITKQ